MRLPWVLTDPALRVILLLTAVAGMAVGLVIPFLTLTARERGVSLTAIGIMASSYLLTQMVLQLPMGSLSDRFGRVGPIAAGIGIEALATIAFAVADGAPAFILLRVVQGVGIALMYPALRALIADLTPVDRRGQAYAGFGAAFSSGMLFGPALGGAIVAATGVNMLFFSAGALELGIAVVGLLALREVGGRRETAADTTRLPYSALLVPSLLGAFILSFASQFQMGLFSGIWSIYLNDIGASDFQIGLSFSTFSVAYLVVAPLGGRLADSGYRWRRLLLANLVLGGVILSYGVVPSVTFILLMGLFEGAVMTIFQPSLDAYLASVADPRVQGRVQGAFVTIGMAGAAISALLGSVLYGIHHLVPFATGGTVLWLLTLIAIRLIRDTEIRTGAVARRATPVVAEPTTGEVAAVPGSVAEPEATAVAAAESRREP